MALPELTIDVCGGGGAGTKEKRENGINYGKFPPSFLLAPFS